MGVLKMSDNEFERTRDFVRSQRRPVRRTAGPRSGSVITSSPATRRGQDPGATDDVEPPAARGRPAPRRECLSHVAGYPVLALVAGYLEEGLRHLGLERVARLSRDVVVAGFRVGATCDDYIQRRTSNSLYHVLETMTRMHWLHSHTGGAYERAVDEEAKDLRDYYGPHPRIYREAIDKVQSMDRFRNLPDRLPWLPQYATSGAALDAAVAAARSS